MDAITLLTEGHDEVRKLFEQFRSAQDASNGQLMRETADKIFAELEVHTTIEEEIFYPAARGKDEDIDETLDESLQEHHVVDVLMEEMRGIESGSDEWVAKMTVLIENVEHHAEEEEEELFPDARKELGDDRIEALGGELEARKATLKAEGATKDELYAKAKEQGVEGRSDMTKDELASAVVEGQD
jgi:hemerythrin-like domain-containing protein